jgi:hypothetical protein
MRWQMEKKKKPADRSVCHVVESSLYLPDNQLISI